MSWFLFLLGCPTQEGVPESASWRAYGDGGATVVFTSADARWEATLPIAGFDAAGLAAVAETDQWQASPATWIARNVGGAGVLSSATDECAYETGDAPGRKLGHVELWAPLGDIALTGIASDCDNWTLEGLWILAVWDRDDPSEFSAYTSLGQLGEYSVGAGPSGATIAATEAVLDEENRGHLVYEASFVDDHCGTTPPAVTVTLDWDLEGPLTTRTDTCPA